MTIAPIAPGIKLDQATASLTLPGTAATSHND
jgi:hypothetical protein